MRYFRDSTHKYPDRPIHAWRVHDDGYVEFRDTDHEYWWASRVLTSYDDIEKSMMLGDVEECNDPFKEYDCPDDN